MERKIITQAQRTTMFNEWLQTQPMPDFKTKEERQRWWVGKVIQHDKMVSEEFDIVPGFYVDNNGKIHHDNKSGEE